jgi:hypothetical protein
MKARCHDRARIAWVSSPHLGAVAMAVCSLVKEGFSRKLDSKRNDQLTCEDGRGAFDRGWRLGMVGEAVRHR